MIFDESGSGRPTYLIAKSAKLVAPIVRGDELKGQRRHLVIHAFVLGVIAQNVETMPKGLPLELEPRQESDALLPTERVLVHHLT